MNISDEELTLLKLGKKPSIVYELCWAGNAFLFKHTGTLDVAVAIRRVEDAMRKLRKEYGMSDGWTSEKLEINGE